MHDKFKNFLSSGPFPVSPLWKNTGRNRKNEKWFIGLDRIWSGTRPFIQDGKITGAAFFAKTITKEKRRKSIWRESEANYRSFFDHSPLPKLLLGAGQPGKFWKFNRSALDKFGYQKENDRQQSLGVPDAGRAIGFFYDSVQHS